MGITAALGIAGLAASVGGTMAGAQASANSAKAQAAQAEINRQWSEFNQEMQLIDQRGAMGLQEFDRLYGNQTLERESLETLVAQRRFTRDQQAYQTQMFVRQSRQLAARQQGTLAGRGMARGGTADAIARQADTDFYADLMRIETNADNQIAMFGNQRNAALKQRNMRPATQPPTYIPSTPIPPANTSGMMTGAALASLGTALGGMAGIAGGLSSNSSTPADAPAQGSYSATNLGAGGAGLNASGALGVNTPGGFMPFGFNGGG